MTRELIKAVIILPGTVLVFVPGLILWQTGWNLAGLNELRFWVALALGLAGMGMARWTMTLFWHIGKGTPAPWAPPKRLVVRGPYRHVRNPMITSVLTMLAAEALMTTSWPIAIWLAIFFAANNIYFPLFEEKGLEARFGDDYRLFKQNVPRWLPRIKGWDLPPDASGE